MSFWDVLGPALAIGGTATGIGGVLSPALAGGLAGAGLGAMKGREKQKAAEEMNEYAKQRTKYSWASGLDAVNPVARPGIWGDIASQAGLGAMAGGLLGGGPKAPVEGAATSAASPLGGSAMASELGKQGSTAVQGLQKGALEAGALTPEALKTMQMQQAFGASSGLPELQSQYQNLNPYKNIWSLMATQSGE